MKIVRRLLASLLLLVLLGAGVVAFLLYTQTGLRWTLAAAQAALPATLEAEALEGRLAGPLTVTNLDYRAGDFRLSIARLVFDWHPGKLLERELRISLLQAERVEVQTAAAPEAESQAPARDFGLPDIRLPLALVIEQASVEQVTIREVDKTEPFGSANIRAALSFDGQTLAVQQLEAQTSGLSLFLQGQVTPAASYPLSLTGHYSLSAEGLPELNGELAVDGNLEHLKLSHRTLAPVNTQLAATLTALLDKPAWKATLEVQQFDTRTVNPAWEPLALQGSVHSQGSLDGYRFEVKTQLGGARIPQGSWSLNGIGTAQAIDVQQLRGETLAGNISGRLRIDNLPAKPHWDAELQVEQFDTTRLDATWEPCLLSGTAGSRGSPDDYSFEVAAEVSGSRIPAGHWSLTGTGNTQAIDLQRLRGETLAGTITGKLQVQIAPHLEWRFATEGKSIDPGLQWPEWPGQLDFALQGSGSQQQDRYRAETQLTRLSGTLAQQPVSASGKLNADQRGFAISALDINAAGAHLFASGEMKEHWALRWNLEAPDLAALQRSAGGSLSASGELTGPRDNPAIHMQLHGNALGFQQHRADSLTLALDWSPDDSKASQLKLEAVDLLLEGQQVSRLEVQGSGLASDHKLGFEIKADAAQLAGQLTGSYHEQSWQGLLSKANLMVTNSDDWLLEKPVRLQVSPQRSDVSTLCLSNRGDGQACVEGFWAGEAGWQAKLRAQALPLALLNPVLPDGMGTRGELHITAQAQQSVGGDPQAELRLSSANGALLYQAADQQQVKLDYRKLLVTGQLQQGLAQLASSAELGDQGHMKGRLELPLAGAPPSQRIDGTLSARLGELGILRGLIPEVDQLDGELTLDAAVGGTFKEPDIDLDLALQDGEASLPAQGITLRDIRLHAEPGAAGTIPFRGQVASGDGTISLTGTFIPARDNGWRISLAIQGSRFEVIDVSEYEVLVSPDLKLDMTPASAQLTGTLDIPQARLRPRQLSGAVRASRDVVIVREGQREGAGYALYSNVRVDLGKQVRFDGFGLKGRFTGSVVVTDTPSQLTSGTGELRIKEGSYKAYGQNLRIERGRLILVGGPLDNPGLDVRAIREVGDVIAGLHVTGKLQEPAVSVFSDPAMSETEALSYLVLGRPLPQDDTEERAEVDNAALALGVGGSLLGKKYGEQVGIDEVDVETESATGEVTLKLGTYLTPDLYVGYGRGLANRINSFLVRYRLTRSLSAETESSSEAVGGDVFYTIER
jgi:translocation and assembly module TamB